MNTNVTEYNLEYMGVKCKAVAWRYPEPHIFYFTKDGKEYEFTQTEYIHFIADIDHIRCVIRDQFLPWLKDERIKELESENAALRDRLNKVIELPFFQKDGEVKEDYKHRAEVAERALLTACAKMVKDEKDDVNIELLVGVVYRKYLKQAEKELAEENKKRGAQ